MCITSYNLGFSVDLSGNGIDGLSIIFISSLPFSFYFIFRDLLLLFMMLLLYVMMMMGLMAIHRGMWLLMAILETVLLLMMVITMSTLWGSRTLIEFSFLLMCLVPMVVKIDGFRSLYKNLFAAKIN